MQRSPVAEQTRPRRQPKRRRWQRRLRYYYRRLARMEGTPAAIARGCAAGVFAGLFPLFGAQTLIGLAIATPLRGNKIAAAVGTWISNPLTYVPIYIFNFKVGQWLLGTEQLAAQRVDVESWRELTQLGAQFLSTLFVGCAIVGAICAVLAYLAALWAVPRLRRTRSGRRKRVRYALNGGKPRSRA
jgi:uncharacterized protein (DUF2062 family)